MRLKHRLILCGAIGLSVLLGSSYVVIKSKQNIVNENEKKFEKYLSSARAYNFFGEEEKALDFLDSLQIGIRKEYDRGLSNANIVDLSELYSRACIERGRIYREEGFPEAAIESFREAITSYFGYDFGVRSNWDPIKKSYEEMAETYEKMGNTEKAAWYWERARKTK